VKTTVYRFAVTILLLGGTVVASRSIDNRPAEALAEPLDSIGTEIGGWTGEPDPPIQPEVLKELDPTSYISRTYRRAGETLSLFVAYYANQRAGESMHSPKHCLPGSGWEFASYGSTTIPAGDREVVVNQHLIQKDGVRMTTIYWYQSKRRVVADEYRAKLYLLRDAVIEWKTGGAIVRIVCSDGPERVQAGRDFAADILPQLQKCMTGSLGTRAR
jgi:EpsI family protein